MADRQRFLETVRSALGLEAGHAVVPEPATALSRDAGALAAEAGTARRQAAARAAELLDELAVSAPKIGWKVTRCATHEDAAEAVLGVCRTAGVRSALRTSHPVFERVPVEAALASTGIELATARRDAGPDASADEAARARLRARTFAVEAGITGVDYAVAETGSVVISPRAGVSRMVSLAPPYHIAIVERGQVLPSLDELFTLAREQFLGGERRGMINIISGPSRTGDIEAKIVTGVHGPVEAHLVIIG